MSAANQTAPLRLFSKLSQRGSFIASSRLRSSSACPCSQTGELVLEIVFVAATVRSQALRSWLRLQPSPGSQHWPCRCSSSSSRPMDRVGLLDGFERRARGGAELRSPLSIGAGNRNSRNYKLGQAPVLPEGARERLFVFALALARFFDQAFDGRVPKARRVRR